MEPSKALLPADPRDVGRPPSSRADLEAEDPALAELAQNLAAAPRALLQKVADVVLGVCEAHLVGDARLIDKLSAFAAAGSDAVKLRDRLKAALTSCRAAAALAEPAGRDDHRLLAIFAHELRSHLAPAKNACEVLRRADFDEAASKRMCATIERQLDAMTRIVGELLDDARFHAGKIELQRRTMSLRDIIARSVELVAALVAARNQELVIDVGADDLRVEADELWLPHALQNIIGNAAKYAEPGGRIELRAGREGACAVIGVRDTGVGLAPDQLESIFDLYTQVEQSPVRPAAEGLGVGLYFARLLIERHGGTIRAASEGLGRGSVFTIRLPCSTSSTAQSAA